MCLSIPNLFCGHDQTRFISETGTDHQTTVPCGSCRTSIIGPRFRCSLCNFTLHPICKTHRQTLSTFLHPEHQLTLVTASVTANRRCNVCFEPVNGLYYTCCNRRCDFDVHPQCSQILPCIRHVLDTRHELQLSHRPRYSTRCNVCSSDCGGWAYRCGVCHVDVHYWCLWKAAVHTATRQPFYFGQNHGGGSNSAVLYWWPGYHNSGGSGSGSGLGFGSGLGVTSNITGSLAVNLLSNLTSNLIQNGFLFN